MFLLKYQPFIVLNSILIWRHAFTLVFVSILKYSMKHDQSYFKTSRYCLFISVMHSSMTRPFTIQIQILFVSFYTWNNLRYAVIYLRFYHWYVCYFHAPLRSTLETISLKYDLPMLNIPINYVLACFISWFINNLK